MTPFGYNGKLLWINLSTSTYHFEIRDETFWRRYIGGGLLATQILMENTRPNIDPLSSENLLIFASSIVAGHPYPGLARFTTAAKSPMTEGIGETRTEGPWGAAIKACGVDAIIFKGASPHPVTVIVSSDGVQFESAMELWGKNTGDTTDAIENMYQGCHVAAIGPAGENIVRFASIVTDHTYQASRMGMGAVMGSKRMKAVVLQPTRLPQPANPDVLEEITHDFEKRIAGNNLSLWQQKPPGFSCWIYLHGLDAALCTENYQQHIFNGLEAFKEENYLARSIQELGCPGCPNACIKGIHPNGRKDLDVRASGIHQEIAGTMGPLIGVGNLDAILEANNICNQLGMDPTSLGFTIAFAMELFQRKLLDPNLNRGRSLNFGDIDGVLALIEDIAFRRNLGDILAEGTKRAAEFIGRDVIQYAMQVKGLEMVPFEPRSQTNLAMGYAVAPIGPRYDICEHDWDFDTEVGWGHTLELSRTLGILERLPMNLISTEKVRMFKALYNLWSAADALDFCIFAIAPTRLLSLEQMASVLKAVTGWETSAYEIMRIGERRNHLMRFYNYREGFMSADDDLPDRFYDESILDGPRKGDCIDRIAFHEAILDFYAMMGWDESGKPTIPTMVDAGLESMVNL